MHPIVNLRNNRHQNIVDNIFESQQVTFRDFETVWKATGGSIYGTHGSHRSLFDSNGQRVSFGIYEPHGNNPLYGKGSINTYKKHSGTLV